MNDDFSDHPKTIGEIRSDKSQKAEHWSPRDALIAALRCRRGSAADTLIDM